MNTFVETMVNDIILKTKNDIPYKVGVNAAHYVMSVLTGIRRITLKNLDEKVVPINYYGITFASSGRGKDLSLNLIKPIIGDVIIKYMHEMETRTATATDIFIPAVEHKEGTASGFLQDREVLDTYGIGCTNVRVQELLSTLKSSDFDQVLNMLTESWDSGQNEARSFKSYVSPPIKFVPTNCLLYTSPEGFRNTSNRSFVNFIENLANGMARRSFIVFDDSVLQEESIPTIESIRLEAEDNKFARKRLEDLKTYVNELTDKNLEITEITMSDDAALALKIYDIENKNKTIRNQLMKDAMSAEMKSRAYKLSRLAAMYAFFDGSDTVSEENVKDAIEWAESLNQDLAVVLYAETIQERIYNYLVKAGKYTSETVIRKYLGITATEFKESIPELFSVAYDDGSVVQKKVFDKEGRVLKYNLIYGKTTESDSMICSSSNHPAEGFVSMKIGFNDIPDLVKGKFGRNYSAGTFIDSYRKTDNFIKSSNLIILDIDDGTTIAQARLFLSNYRGFIATTKSHQIEKHGKPPCDRFRVILISQFEFNLDPEEHKATIKNMAKFIGLNVDWGTVEVARFYYAFPEADIIKLDGENLVDLRDYVPDTELAVEAEEIIKRVEHQTRRTEHYEPNDNINTFDAWALRTATVGSRNTTLHKLYKALQDHKGATSEEAATKVYQINAMLTEPLGDDELQRTLLRDA